ncbi:MAG: GntR family transcriptional regulator [Rhodobacteraceae bacterium]|nr:GntR family transcriptional regulator [Paracoccaceae bacterium]MAY47410.1 GntR family transcriptional regulator [Paracoccaceae bacterium]QEW19447.1 Carbon starvation induced regulator [Marinibacterium anthonyi]
MNIKSFVQDQTGESVGDSALRRIRFDIIRGTLRPGERLRLERVREAYGLSVTTLREILSRLVVERFVVAEGQRGFEVGSVCEADLRDICELRLLLECHALRRSIDLGTLDWEAHVVSTHHKLQSVEAKLMDGAPSSVEQWVQFDWDFHHATLSACDMPALMATHSNVFDRYLRYHLLALDFRGRPAADEHRRLRDLVIAREPEPAVALLTAHVRAGMEHILATGKFT